MAMTEQVTGRPIPDVVTLQTRQLTNPGGVAVQSTPPSARFIAKSERSSYARRKNRVVIRHGRGKVIAIIEIVVSRQQGQPQRPALVCRKGVRYSQPGHPSGYRRFVPAGRRAIRKGFTRRFGTNSARSRSTFCPTSPLPWPRTSAATCPLRMWTRWDWVDVLPSAPIFLTGDVDYVPCPLEATYNQAWAVYPRFLKELMESPKG